MPGFARALAGILPLFCILACQLREPIAPGKREGALRGICIRLPAPQAGDDGRVLPAGDYRNVSEQGSVYEVMTADGRKAHVVKSAAQEVDCAQPGQSGQEAVDQGEADQDRSGQGTADRGLIWFDVKNYQTHQGNPSFQAAGPYVVYAWLPDSRISGDRAYFRREIESLQSANGPSIKTKAVMFTGLKSMQANLTPQLAQDLKRSGISIIGYNTEGAMACQQGSQSHTPCDEITTIHNANEGNAVVRFAAYAESLGLISYWGPIRSVLDAVPAAAVSLMIQRGLDGIGVQEQNSIASQCDRERLTAFNALRRKSVKPSGAFQFNVQLMSVKCSELGSLKASCPGHARYGRCIPFAKGVLAKGGSLSVWAMDRASVQDMAEFISAVRE